MLGRIIDYRQAAAGDGTTKRKTIKVFADSDVVKMVFPVCKRLQSIETQWEDYNPDQIQKQLNKTDKLITELEDKVYKHDWVPRGQYEFLTRMATEIRTKFKEIKSRQDVSLMDDLDALLKNI